MGKLIDKYPIATLCIFVLVMMLPNLDALNVTIMEARNFITAREMVYEGNWLLTTMNGEPRYQKPPLPTWITALFGLTSGVKSIFALRFPTVLMILLIGIFTFLFSNRILKNQFNSLINALIVVTSFYVIGITIEAPWDIYTHAFMLMAIYYIFSVFEKQTNNLVIFIAAVFIGLSLLSKGPVSLYALFLPFLLAYGLTYKLNKKNVLQLIVTLVLGLFIGGWWFWYVRIADPEAFLEITKKETGNWSSYNVRPFYYYWSFFTQSGLWTIPAFIGLLYPYLKRKVSNLKAYKLSLLWTIFAVILLSVIPEKKSRYLMPVLIPLAINTGFYINYLIKHFKNLSDKRETVPVYFNFGLLSVIGLGFPIVAFIILKDNLADFWFEYAFASLILFVVGLFMIVNLFKKQLKSVFYLTIVLFASIMIASLPLNKVFFDNEDYLSISSLKSESNFPIYSYNYFSPEMIWDFGDKIPNSKNQSELEKHFGLLTNEKLETLHEIFKNYSIDYQKTYDINTVSKEKKDYKDRLKADYYILSKP